MTRGSQQLENAKESIFELIEFRLDRNVNGQVISGRYGINVAKVREVVRMPKINPLTSRIDGLAGVFELRGVPIPVVHLAKFFGDEQASISEHQKVLVAEFGVKRAGFVVDSAHRIRRVRWSDVLPPAADGGSYISSMTLVENNEFLFILDFETMISDLESMSNKRTRRSERLSFHADSTVTSKAADSQAPNRSGAPLILLVDDSPIILKNTMISLQRHGYNVVTASNGQEAYDALKVYAVNKNIMNNLAAIVTDLEMPKMDGFTLIKNIRQIDALANLPVIIHSSLSGQSTKTTGSSMGANRYVVKNDIKNLINVLNETLGWKSNVSIGA